METEKAAALLCVLEKGSITAAAESLGYTASGLSRMMAALEADCGFPLLVRQNSGVSPTADCRRLIPSLRELARLGALWDARCAALRGLETGQVRIGSAYSAYDDWLARLMASFSKQYPGIELRFLQGSSSRLYALMEAHELDFCIASHREGDFEFLVLREDPLMAWVPADHPRAREGAYPLEDFSREPYIDTYPGEDTDNSRAFRRHGLAPCSQFQSLDVRSTRAMVAAGLGVSLNNQLLSHGLDLSGIAVLPTLPPCQVAIGVATPPRAELSPAAGHFLTHALKNLPPR